MGIAGHSLELPVLNWLARDALGETHALDAVQASEQNPGGFEPMKKGVTVEEHSMQIVIAGMEQQKTEDQELLSGVALDSL